MFKGISCISRLFSQNAGDSNRNEINALSEGGDNKCTEITQPQPYVRHVCAVYTYSTSLWTCCC